jgi:hypothetical protein
MSMPPPSNPASGGETGVMEVVKVDESIKTEKFGRGMIAIIFVAGAILGAAVGTGLASYVLESEFSEFRDV